MTSFDIYQLPAEYDQLRATVRALAEEKIAPWAAEVDEQERFPAEALSALVGADLHAAHVPAIYGGQGADALAVCLIIEEVARVCGSSSLIPAVNKLGSAPVLLAG
ncbi:MAG: acyl-CoA dehydrogenase family protein, partial [Candidatus Nanopelagicales bacterium]